MLSVKGNIVGLENIDKVINMTKIDVNSGLTNYIKEKVEQVLQEVMNEKLVGGTTNDEEIQEYRKRNEFISTSNGFILKNDTMALPGQYGHESYPFSIALAFEFGVGIVGATNPKTGAWDYDIKGHGIDGWDYSKYSINYHTTGYEGMEIYRTIAIRVNDNLSKWTKEYLDGRV